MAVKFEVYKKVAQSLEGEGVVKVAYGPKTYRGCTYDAPMCVTVLDRDALDKAIEEAKVQVDRYTKALEAGEYGSGAKLNEATFGLMFMSEVKDKRYLPCPEEPAEQKPVQEPAQEPVQKPAEPNNDAMNILASVVADVVARSSGAEVVEKISEQAIKMVQKFIADEYGPIVKKVEIVTPAGEVKHVDGMVHEAFDEVLVYVQADEPVFLVGPAGCGKNVLCKQVAEALGLDFYFSNAVTQEYKITGFTDAMGVYQESQFYKAFTKGGLFFLDEMDASIAEVLLILNSAIANRYFDFPAPIGRVEAHPDFRVVSAGNTVGQGASFEYVGRNQLDASSLDRFAVIQVGYDQRVELSVAGGDSELVEFIHKVRDVCEKAGVSLITSYRSIGRIAKMSKVLPLAKVLRECLFKGMTAADLATIQNGVKGMSNRYAEVLLTL